jgi:hypothetical protein
MSDLSGLRWTLRRAISHETGSSIVGRPALDRIVSMFRGVIENSDRPESRTSRTSLHDAVTRLLQNGGAAKIALLSVRLIVRLLNERVTALWNSRENFIDAGGGVSKRICEASVLYNCIDQLALLLNYESEPPWRRDGGRVCRRVGTDSTTVLSLKSRLDQLVRYYSHNSAAQQTKLVLEKQPQSFSSLSSISSMDIFGHVLRRWFLRGVKCSGCNDGQSLSKGSENIIGSALRLHAIGTVHRSVLHVQPESVDLAVHVAEIAVNATVRGLLHAIMTQKVHFDELGVYKLYRILLQLHEAAGELKVELGLQSSQRLVTDPTEWRRAEAVLQTLNLAVFAKTEHSSNKRVPRTSGCLSTTRTATAHAGRSERSGPEAEGEQEAEGNAMSPVLSQAETQRWRGLVHPPKRTLLPRRSRRHKGTVFTTLSFDFEAL